MYPRKELRGWISTLTSDMWQVEVIPHGRDFAAWAVSKGRLVCYFLLSSLRQQQYSQRNIHHTQDKEINGWPLTLLKFLDGY